MSEMNESFPSGRGKFEISESEHAWGKGRSGRGDIELIKRTYYFERGIFWACIQGVYKYNI
jgi:hypothetical protein